MRVKRMTDLRRGVYDPYFVASVVIALIAGLIGYNELLRPNGDAEVLDAIYETAVKYDAAGFDIREFEQGWNQQGERDIQIRIREMPGDSGLCLISSIGERRGAC